MKKKVFRTSGIERWGFALFMAGQGIINALVGSYLQLTSPMWGLRPTQWV